MTYRDDLTALAARHDALAGEVARKTRELDESRRLLDQARARARLPVLDNLRVASPCTADWNQMTGDERTRHCGDCKKDVYNLSGMTRDEAEALLIERAGNLCVRYFQRHDGTILLADCTIGAKRRSRRRWIAAGAAAMLAGGAGAVMLRSARVTMGAMSPEAMHDQLPPRATMGKYEGIAPPQLPSDVLGQSPGEDAPDAPAPRSMQLPAEPAPAERWR